MEWLPWAKDIPVSHWGAMNPVRFFSTGATTNSEADSIATRARVLPRSRSSFRCRGRLNRISAAGFCTMLLLVLEVDTTNSSALLLFVVSTTMGYQLFNQKSDGTDIVSTLLARAVVLASRQEASCHWQPNTEIISRNIISWFYI